MTLTPDEKKAYRNIVQRKYRKKCGSYSEAQKNAIYKYLNKKREENNKPPLG